MAHVLMEVKLERTVTQRTTVVIAVPDTTSHQANCMNAGRRAKMLAKGTLTKLRRGEAAAEWEVVKESVLGVDTVKFRGLKVIVVDSFVPKEPDPE